MERTMSHPSCSSRNIKRAVCCAILAVVWLSGSSFMNAKPEWHPFDYVSRNIFIHCTLEGPEGKSKQADLILDTGMNRSSVSPALASELGLHSAGTTTSRAPGGTIVDNMAVLHK